MWQSGSISGGGTSGGGVRIAVVVVCDSDGHLVLPICMPSNHVSRRRNVTISHFRSNILLYLTLSFIDDWNSLEIIC